jgi:predicted nucleic acid-binding protein
VEIVKPDLELFIKKITGLKSVSLDSSVLIYHLEKVAPYCEMTQHLIKVIAAESIFCTISALSVTELLVKPYRLKDIEKVRLFENFIQSLPGTEIQSVDYAIAKLAASIRADYNIRTPDAILISTAFNAGAQCFITNDTALKKISLSGLEVFIMDDYLNLTPVLPQE